MRTTRSVWVCGVVSGLVCAAALVTAGGCSDNKENKTVAQPDATKQKQQDMQNAMQNFLQQKGQSKKAAAK
jgi:putative hemolysin